VPAMTRPSCALLLEYGRSQLSPVGVLSLAPQPIRGWAGGHQVTQAAATDAERPQPSVRPPMRGLSCRRSGPVSTWIRPVHRVVDRVVGIGRADGWVYLQVDDSVETVVVVVENLYLVLVLVSDPRIVHSH
jgi:hypothetical protein